MAHAGESAKRVPKIPDSGRHERHSIHCDFSCAALRPEDLLQRAIRVSLGPMATGVWAVGLRRSALGTRAETDSAGAQCRFIGDQFLRHRPQTALPEPSWARIESRGKSGDFRHNTLGCDTSERPQKRKQDDD